MEVTDELITDMIGRYIRFRKGDGVEPAKTKVIEEFSINTSMEKIELTYEMPEWMDVDGSVKPVPIHIVSDDNMDMFLAMRVDINEMKLFMVPLMDDNRVTRLTRDLFSDFERGKSLSRISFTRSKKSVPTPSYDIGDITNHEVKAKGSPNGSYGILPSYLHMLTRANVGTVTDLHTELEIDGDSRYNIMTSNVAESLNAVLKEARELPIVSTLEYIRVLGGTLMTWFEKRREKATQHDKPLTPKVEEIVQRNYERSTSYDVAKINNEQYEMKTTTGLSYVVDIQKRTCTCEEFNLLQIPCSHAIAAAICCDMSVPMLAAPQYGSFFWSLAYTGGIYPVPDLSTLREVPDRIATLTVLPPLTRRPPGRPNRTRYLSTGEFERPKKITKRSCTRCRGTGHNRASNKMPI
ncbi:unnamed protein product [Arabidopsis arenosa]|uniref:SWIM-type domain-containing protein n=1 Tax=Arabidopsis arenosa TaxID=38785 RepID=A0A8S2A4P8_ARAAE|nr:unnamed protein product [Arabidopsis arenosa]